MKLDRQWTWTSRGALAAAITIAFCSAGIALAQKGGKGGGGGGASARFSVLELPVDGRPIALSEVSASDVITVAIEGSEAGYVSAAFAQVDRSTRAVLASRFLPEPPFVDPNDGQFKNGWSQPADVNVFGEIVGQAGAFDPDSTGDPSPSRATLWVDDGAGYSLMLLPQLPDTTWSIAIGINNPGDIVGMCRLGAGDAADVAVLWDAETLTPVDLNTVETAALGWELRAAHDINDDGLIVGHGSRRSRANRPTPWSAAET